MMSKNTDNLINQNKAEQQLVSYGLTIDEARVYLFLKQEGRMTPLQLSRDMNIPRTRVYRTVESLRDQGLVVEHKDSRGASYSAEHPMVFEEFLKDQVAKLEEKQKEVPALVEILGSVGVNTTDADIKVYRGIEGLKQITWNSLRADGELLTYEIGNLDDFIDSHKYAEMLRQKFVDNGIRIKTLTNRKKVGKFTEVTEMLDDMSQMRHLPKKTLDIKYEMLIYNDTYALYRYHDDYMFGVEIVSPEVAYMQRQIFESFWRQGKKLDVKDERT